MTVKNTVGQRIGFHFSRLELLISMKYTAYIPHLKEKRKVENYSDFFVLNWVGGGC